MAARWRPSNQLGQDRCGGSYSARKPGSILQDGLLRLLTSLCAPKSMSGIP